MTQPSGWYDDPHDPSQLRYWDGVVWSSHVAPRVSPTVAQSNIGMPYGVTPASARPPAAGSHGAQGPPAAPGVFRPPGQGQGEGQQGQGQGQQDGPWPAYGQGPGPLGQGQYGWESHPSLPTTPDGVVLSGWWKRVLARFIDSLIIDIVTLPLTFAPIKAVFDIFMDYIQRVGAAVEAGSSTMPPQPTAELVGPAMQISLTVLVAYLFYEVALLTMTGATPGRKVAGISVRLRDKAGPPPLGAVLKRTAVKEVGSVVGSVPVVGTMGSFFSVLDVLWPLWDVKRQAIHDKVAATNVVVGPQPKRGTPDATPDTRSLTPGA